MIINGTLDLSNCRELKNISGITQIKGNLKLNNCNNLISLGDLEEVEAYLYLVNCKYLKSLGKLKNYNNQKGIRLARSGITEQYIKREKSRLLKNCFWDY